MSVFVFTVVITILKLSIPKNYYSNGNFKVLGLNIPSKLDFAGELVPQNDYEIKESLEQEFFANKSWKSSSLVLFQKAQKWFPLIEPILKREGIPDDFKYIAVIESHLSNVVSPMGAAGFWQLMPNTAQGYGLIVNQEVDERYDVEKATVVACKHFKDAYHYFHNWTLSAAAYNVGIGGIQKALKKQYTDNYYDLLLNNETGSFIYRILAFKTLLSNPTYFGINTKFKKMVKFPSLKIIKIDSSITNFAAFAKHLETNVITLRTFNAWLIGDKLSNPEKHIFQFKIPKNKNIDLSIYFNDVYPQEKTADTLINKLILDTIISKPDSVFIPK
jgi:membrane-bound lytic murein transglycosylase D